MKLCGAGFMIASEKNDDGSWDWRTFGSGEGFTADLITAGFLSADRIQAHAITANHLASDVGETLDLSSNTSIQLKVEQAVDTAVGYRMEIVADHGDVLSERVPSTTLRARVWKGSSEITESLAASRFRWSRMSQDDTGDRVWNAAHAGVKELVLTTADVLYSATYSCELTEDDSAQA